MTGQFAAIVELMCGCRFDTGRTMLTYRAQKGQLTDCEEHGLQKTKCVRSGEPRSSLEEFYQGA